MIRSLLSAAVLAALSAAQTPFEFAVVQELIQGEPYIGVMRIEISQSDPAPGRTTLELAARAGLDLRSLGMSVFPDTTEMFMGQTIFTIDTDQGRLARLFSVISQESARFRAGITDLAVDLVAPDEMSWLSLECPLPLADSMARGLVSSTEFWSRARVTSLEIGTGTFPLEYEPPVAVSRAARETVVPIAQDSGGSARHSWKSLILPGWGQASAGEGLWWVNLLVEAGGIGLVLSDHETEGCAVLGVNHIVSFTDLL